MKGSKSTIPIDTIETKLKTLQLENKMHSKASVLISVNEGIIALDLKNSLLNLGFNVKLSPKNKIINNLDFKDFPDLLIIDTDFLSQLQIDEVIKFYSIFNVALIFISSKNKRYFDSINNIKDKVFILFKPFDEENLIKIVNSALIINFKVKQIPENQTFHSA